MLCKICQREFKNYRVLGMHVFKTHKLDTHEYYDKFLRSRDEGTCSECGKKTKFRHLGMGYQKFCSCKCRSHSGKVKDKIKQTCLERYGVENPFQSLEVQEKIKSTCLEKYGVTLPRQAREIDEKIKQTCLERYGVECTFQSPEIQEKTRQVCLEKYGTKYPSQLPEVQNKTKEMFLEKYGVESSNQVSEIKEKKEQACIKRLGVRNPSQAIKVKQRKKETLLEHYGVESPLQSEQIQAKFRNTCLERYGVSHPSQTRKFKDDASSRMLNGHSAYIRSFISCPSKPQIELFNLVSSLYSDTVLEFPIKVAENKHYSIDIAIPSLKVAIEYDGSYWHQNLERDQIRQKEIENLGWKFLRYCDFIPELKELSQRLKELTPVVEKQ